MGLLNNNLLKCESKNSSTRNIQLQEILAVIPLHRLRNASRLFMVNALVSTKLLAVRIKYNTVSAWNLNTNTIVGVGVSWVEVKHKQQPSTLKDNHSITLMLQRNVCLWGREPLILGL